MSQTELLSAPKNPWMDLVNADVSARSLMSEFLRLPMPVRQDFVRDGLRADRQQRATALRVIPFLTLTERQAIFPELLKYASCGHGLAQKFRDLILALPREWVIENIERAAEPLLASSSEEYQFEEYRRLLELYAQIGDRDLLERLAKRAAAHTDEDIREAGQEALERLHARIE